MEAMRAQLAQTPADVVIANHCYGLFELAAIYLSQTPPVLFQARLAIDALGALLDGVAGRLGEAEPQLRESLSQLRLAFVSLEGAEASAAESSANNGDRPDGRPDRPSGLRWVRAAAARPAPRPSLLMNLPSWRR